MPAGCRRTLRRWRRGPCMRIHQVTHGAGALADSELLRPGQGQPGRRRSTHVHPELAAHDGRRHHHGDVDRGPDASGSRCGSATVPGTHSVRTSAHETIHHHVSVPDRCGRHLDGLLADTLTPRPWIVQWIQPSTRPSQPAELRDLKSARATPSAPGAAGGSIRSGRVSPPAAGRWDGSPLGTPGASHALGTDSAALAAGPFRSRPTASRAGQPKIPADLVRPSRASSHRAIGALCGDRPGLQSEHGPQVRRSQEPAHDAHHRQVHPFLAYHCCPPFSSGMTRPGWTSFS